MLGLGLGFGLLRRRRRSVPTHDYRFRLPLTVNNQDISGYGNHLDLVYGTNITEDGLVMSGDGYTEIAYAPSLGLSFSLTFLATVTINNMASVMPIIYKLDGVDLGNPGFGNWKVRLIHDVPSGKAYLTVDVNNEEVTGSSHPLVSVGETVKIAVTLGENGYARGYINGFKVFEVAITVIPSSDAPFVIAGVPPSSAQLEYLDGTLRDLALIAEELSQLEIIAEQNLTFNFLSDENGNIFTDENGNPIALGGVS
jgi:hypothetical protein